LRIAHDSPICYTHLYYISQKKLLTSFLAIVEIVFHPMLMLLSKPTPNTMAMLKTSIKNIKQLI